MEWEAVAAVLSVLGTIGLGTLTFVRGSKSDQALNIATNIQTTFEANKSLVDNLQEEVERYMVMTRKCETACRECRSNLAGAHMVIRAQEEEIEKLKLAVAKCERTINSMSRREDKNSEGRKGDEERRRPTGG